MLLSGIQEQAAAVFEASAAVFEAWRVVASARASAHPTASSCACLCVGAGTVFGVLGRYSLECDVEIVLDI